MDKISVIVIGKIIFQLSCLALLRRYDKIFPKSPRFGKALCLLLYIFACLLYLV